ncbi:MAG: epoxyqueuosine reductase QueH [Clostridiales bacterium]|nr:epoxyqueuosine reductase QueH [Clostridiales bacterium]
MKQNYDLCMQQVIKSLQGKPRLLLHSCCGPCSSAVLERLTPHFEVTVYFFNPCIHPSGEYEKRLSEQRRLIREAHLPVKILEAPYEPESYFALVKGLESAPEGGDRCLVCFRQRLEATARAAKDNGFDYFTTTLTVSPHKNAENLNRIGAETAQAAGVPFLPCDFKKRSGYLRSLQLSAEYKLYRQDYCGCVYSRRDQDTEQA